MSDYRDSLVQLRTELSHLHIREHKILTAIASLERLEGLGEVEVDPDNPQPFATLPLGDAAQELLTERGALATRELAELMLKGGTRTKARNFVATLYSLLYKDGRFVLEDGRWRLKGATAATSTTVR